jgi:hypothetical protein
MPNLEYFLVCRSVQEDKNTGEMSFINVIEDIAPEAYPLQIPKAIAVSLWNFQPGEETTEYQATLVIKLPGNVHGIPFPMNFSKGVNRCKAIQGVIDIPLDAPGDLIFEVLLNSAHQATHTVKVHPVGVRALPEGGERLSSG